MTTEHSPDEHLLAEFDKDPRGRTAGQVYRQEIIKLKDDDCPYRAGDCHCLSNPDSWEGRTNAADPPTDEEVTAWIKSDNSASLHRTSAAGHTASTIEAWSRHLLNNRIESDRNEFAAFGAHFEWSTETANEFQGVRPTAYILDEACIQQEDPG